MQIIGESILNISAETDKVTRDCILFAYVEYHLITIKCRNWPGVGARDSLYKGIMSLWSKSCENTCCFAMAMMIWPCCNVVHVMTSQLLGHVQQCDIFLYEPCSNFHWNVFPMHSPHRISAGGSLLFMRCVSLTLTLTRLVSAGNEGKYPRQFWLSRPHMLLLFASFSNFSSTKLEDLPCNKNRSKRSPTNIVPWFKNKFHICGNLCTKGYFFLYCE